jgi:predicted nucleotidyltransferase component of viral defense system
VKDHLLQIVGEKPAEERRNLAREYLQVYMLRLMHEIGAHYLLGFLGGTALRLLHRLPRFSEDIDFSLAMGEREQQAAFEPEQMFRKLLHRLELAGYQVSAKMKTRHAVVSAMYRFAGLPRLLGWSPDPRIALSIKVEVDTNPPSGARVESTLIQRFFPIALRHYDLPSLFAGKLHAVLTRSYTKGRDWFDLAWYLTELQGLDPNFELLQNALDQTGNSHIAAVQWRHKVRDRLRQLDWLQVLADIEPFVERTTDLDQLDPTLLDKLLR